MKTLGTTTTYHGTEHAYLRGHKVRISSVAGCHASSSATRKTSSARAA